MTDRDDPAQAYEELLQFFYLCPVGIVKFAPDGRISEHIDHWDAAAQFYERIPVLGWLIRKVRRRLELPPSAAR